MSLFNVVCAYDHTWESTNLQWIGKRLAVVIDRPMGSRHPQYGFLYPVNYGYVPGTMAPDGEEQDAYVLRVAHPVSRFEGVCIAEIVRLDDVETKLVVVPDGESMSDDEIFAEVGFQEVRARTRLLR